MLFRKICYRRREAVVSLHEKASRQMGEQDFVAEASQRNHGGMKRVAVYGGRDEALGREIFDQPSAEGTVGSRRCASIGNESRRDKSTAALALDPTVSRRFRLLRGSDDHTGSASAVEVMTIPFATDFCPGLRAHARTQEDLSLKAVHVEVIPVGAVRDV